MLGTGWARGHLSAYLMPWASRSRAHSPILDETCYRHSATMESSVVMVTSILLGLPLGT